MTLETQGENRPEKRTPTAERNKIVEEVHRRYYEILLGWCSTRLKKRYIGSNPATDAEDIVAYLEERLLTDKIPIDLTKNENEVRTFLSKRLDEAIIDVFYKEHRQKRMPQGGFVSLEQVLEERDDDDIPLQEQYFAESPGNTEELQTSDNEEMYSRIEQALSILKKRDRKKADIIIKSYLEGKNDYVIAEEYNQTHQNISLQRIKGLKILKKLLTNKKIIP